MCPTAAEPGLTVVASAMIAIVACAPATTTADAQEPDSARLESRAAGCFTITVGDWDPPRAERESAFQSPPSRVRLTTERGTERLERDRLLLRPVIDPAPRGRTVPGMAYWHATPTDSLRLVWTTGYVGVTATLALRGDRVDGRAVAFTDAIVPGQEDRRPTAPVTGRRVECRETDPQ
ncbi:MAG: hypothetical protein ACODAE_10515 [Gemmatimonadota bacterium]